MTRSIGNCKSEGKEKAPEETEIDILGQAEEKSKLLENYNETIQTTERRTHNNKRHKGKTVEVE